MAALNRIKRISLASAAGAALAFGFAVAGLLGLALVLIPGAVGILAMEWERAKHRRSKAKDFSRNQATTQRAEACAQKDSKHAHPPRT